MNGALATAVVQLLNAEAPAGKLDGLLGVTRALPITDAEIKERQECVQPVLLNLESTTAERACSSETAGQSVTGSSQGHQAKLEGFWHVGSKRARDM